MRHLLITCSSSLLLLVACGGEPSTHDHGHADHQEVPTPMDHDGHDHAAVDEHAGHDHGHAGDEGEAHALGTTTLGSHSLRVELIGEVEAGSDAVLDIGATADGTLPSQLRVWIGAENGRGSVKTLLQADEHGHIHGHVEVPGELPDRAALWLETTGDERQRTSLALPGEHAH